MLRASAKSVGHPVDAVAAVSGDEVELAVPHGPLLVGFVDAIVAGDAGDSHTAREALAAAASPAAVADAAAILANFEMMTRVADSTGARVQSERLESTRSERERLGVDAFSSAR